MLCVQLCTVAVVRFHGSTVVDPAAGAGQVQEVMRRAAVSTRMLMDDVMNQRGIDFQECPSTAKQGQQYRLSERVSAGCTAPAAMLCHDYH